MGTGVDVGVAGVGGGVALDGISEAENKLVREKLTCEGRYVVNAKYGSEGRCILSRFCSFSASVPVNTT